MGRSTVVVKRGELRVNSPFRPDETSWSPVSAIIGDDSSTVATPRRGPSLLFAITVIGVVALATAGAVKVFFMEPFDGEANAQPVIAQDAPVETASLDPTFLPVRKVVTQHIRAVAEPQPAVPAAATPAADDVAADLSALEPLDPRWARTASPTPEAVASVAATIPPVSALVEPAADNSDPTDGTETGAIEPDETALPRAAKQAADPGAEAKATDDPMSLVKARPTQLRTAANMRSRPKSGSGIIMVVPQSATVQLVGCKVWCEIVYKGRRGYVYKDFLGGSRSASNSARSKSSAAKKPKPVTTVDTTDAGDTADAAGLPGVETPKIKSTSTRLQ